MRISDWSSDVCSSDLGYAPGTGDGDFGDVIVAATRVDDSAPCGYGNPPRGLRLSDLDGDGDLDVVWSSGGNRGICVVHHAGNGVIPLVDVEIGRASCRERVCQVG